MHWLYTVPISDAASQSQCSASIDPDICFKHHSYTHKKECKASSSKGAKWEIIACEMNKTYIDDNSNDVELIYKLY